MIATVVSNLIIALALPAFNHADAKTAFIAFNNPVHIVALIIITVICGLVAGSYPSLYLSSFNPVLVLKGLKLKTGSAAFIRKGLVVFSLLFPLYSSSVLLLFICRYSM